MFSSLHTSTLAVRRVEARCFPSGVQGTLLQRLTCALRVRRERKALARLDDVRLADIGLSAEDARREASRPFWDAPRSWYR